MECLCRRHHRYKLSFFSEWTILSYNDKLVLEFVARVLRKTEINISQYDLAKIEL